MFFSEPEGNLQEYVEDISHVMLDSHMAYMTSWNGESRLK